MFTPIPSLPRVALCVILVVATSATAFAQVDARMFRSPDVSATHIAFVYAGDIWVVSKAGGLASRLSSPLGEETAPHFSPDGTRIAFSANYDGNTDVYVVPTLGGDPVRLTHHPMSDRVLGWHPDGTRILFSSSRESGRQRYSQFFLVNARGGLPEKLAIPYGEDASFSSDGRQVAYVPQSQANRTWKRYRGGWAPDLRLFDLRTLESSKIAADAASDEHPMWHAGRIYFLSDRGPGQRHNIWVVDVATGTVRQITRFREFDISFPAIGPTDIVFQAGGTLYLLDLASEKTTEVSVQVVTDRLTLKPRTEKVAALLQSASVSPAGKRAAFEKTVIDDADGFEPTADGKKLLVVNEKKYAILEVKAGQKLEKPMRTADMEMTVEPMAEWKQIFEDAYRLERDYFYDPNMHGVDWKATRDRYARLIDQSATRWDVNAVLGEFIGELNASHTYRGGGDLEQSARRGVGMLGIDWELANGAYRIRHIVRGAPWDVDVRSPLAEPGLAVKEGDYVLAVNGTRLDAQKDPWAAFQGLAGQTVSLTINSKPSDDGGRQVVVTCLEDEEELRFREWTEQRRTRVDAATQGRVGYVYVQSTGIDAQNELVRQFMAQWRKDGLVIDERFNSGGQIPDRFIELLNRPMLSYWGVRYGESWQWPPVAHRGPKVMLINGWSGSGGDAFPFYFREAKLGPIVGTRTWGGLIGISGVPSLVDGGGLTVPTFRMFDVRGQWFAEGHGVEPDIEVDEDPTALARGRDPQLERAIEEVVSRLPEATPIPSHPPFERRVPNER